jgi:hypothetical protein
MDNENDNDNVVRAASKYAYYRLRPPSSDKASEDIAQENSAAKKPVNHISHAISLKLAWIL